MVAGVNLFNNRYFAGGLGAQSISRTGENGSSLSFGGLTAKTHTKGASFGGEAHKVDYKKWSPESLAAAQTKAVQGISGTESISGIRATEKVSGVTEPGSLQDFKTNHLKNCNLTAPEERDELHGNGIWELC